jgi:hypothetical protein
MHGGIYALDGLIHFVHGHSRQLSEERTTNAIIGLLRAYVATSLTVKPLGLPTVLVATPMAVFSLSGGPIAAPTKDRHRAIV